MFYRFSQHALIYLLSNLFLLAITLCIVYKRMLKWGTHFITFAYEMCEVRINFTKIRRLTEVGIKPDQHESWPHREVSDIEPFKCSLLKYGTKIFHTYSFHSKNSLDQRIMFLPNDFFEASKCRQNNWMICSRIITQLKNIHEGKLFSFTGVKCYVIW